MFHALYNIKVYYVTTDTEIFFNYILKEPQLIS